MTNTTELQRKVRTVFDFYRGLILDSVENEVGDIEQWQFLRSRLLKCLGDRGLEGQVLALLDHPEKGKYFCENNTQTSFDI